MVSSMATAFGFLLSALISSALGSFYSKGQARLPNLVGQEDFFFAMPFYYLVAMAVTLVMGIKQKRNPPA